MVGWRRTDAAHTSVVTGNVSPSPAPLWTPWGKGFKGVALRSAPGPPYVQRPALGSYTTCRDASPSWVMLTRCCGVFVQKTCS